MDELLDAVAEALPIYTQSGTCECGEHVGRNPDDLKRHSAGHVVAALAMKLLEVPPGTPLEQVLWSSVQKPHWTYRKKAIALYMRDLDG